MEKVSEEELNETRQAPCETDGGGQHNEETPTAVTLLEEVEQVMPEEGGDGLDLSIVNVLGGEILGGKWMRRQIKLIALMMLLTVLYITNRYSAEQELIEIEDCKKELQDIKYRSLTRSSELTMRTRQSMIEEALRQAGDSTLQIAKESPFVIVE